MQYTEQQLSEFKAEFARRRKRQLLGSLPVVAVFIFLAFFNEKVEAFLGRPALGGAWGGVRDGRGPRGLLFVELALSGLQQVPGQGSWPSLLSEVRGPASVNEVPPPLRRGRPFRSWLAHEDEGSVREGGPPLGSIEAELGEVGPELLEKGADAVLDDEGGESGAPLGLGRFGSIHRQNGHLSLKGRVPLSVRHAPLGGHGVCDQVRGIQAHGTGAVPERRGFVAQGGVPLGSLEVRAQDPGVRAGGPSLVDERQIDPGGRVDELQGHDQAQSHGLFDFHFERGADQHRAEQHRVERGMRTPYRR